MSATIAGERKILSRGVYDLYSAVKTDTYSEIRICVNRVTGSRIASDYPKDFKDIGGFDGMIDVLRREKK